MKNYIRFQGQARARLPQSIADFIRIAPRSGRLPACCRAKARPQLRPTSGELPNAREAIWHRTTHWYVRFSPTPTKDSSQARQEWLGVSHGYINSRYKVGVPPEKETNSGGETEVCVIGPTAQELVQVG
jgi:hypothetical protein